MSTTTTRAAALGDWWKRIPESQRRHLLPVLAAALAVNVLIQGHYWFMVPEPRTVSVDEGYMASFGLRLLHGRGLPYVDAVSQRGR